jgi:hypothetical protein
MKKHLSAILIAILPAIAGFSQKVSSKLIFTQGQTFSIKTELKTTVSQEAMGNAIDFVSNGTAVHIYKVTNTTDDNSTLHHEVKRLSFNFDGMGTKRSFDSDNKKDREGPFGATANDILSKSYDMIVDPAGKTLVIKPEKIELVKMDDRLAIVFNMLKDLTHVVYPPKKNEASFFKVMPDTAVGINDSWTEISENENGKTNTVYTLSAITDSTIIIDLKGKSSSVTKAEMMGTPTTTTMSNSYTGKIILDKATGIIREKTITTISNGSTEAMGGNMPVTSKTTITIYVNAVQ